MLKITAWGVKPKRKHRRDGKCSRCEQVKDGAGNYCKRCHAEYNRITRPRHSQLPDEQRKRANSRAYANVYQKRGILVPQPCADCGTEGHVEKHHQDYSRPLDVIWLCRKCHLARHKKDEIDQILKRIGENSHGN